MTTQHAGRARPEIPHYPLVIDGRRTDSVSGRSYQTIDPFLQVRRVHLRQLFDPANGD
jgi:hypothetical protein